MILNTYSVVVLFISFLIGIVCVILAIVSLRTYQTGKYADDLFYGFQQKEYLLLHIAQVILVVEALLWPFMYFMLQSFVPYIEGAMCVFGVTQSQPVLSIIVQVYKAMVFFLVGWWLIIDRIDKEAERAPLFKIKTLSLFFISLFIVFDSIITVYYITGFNVEVDVACCTTVFDLQERKTTVLSKAILGSTFQKGLLMLYLVTNTLFALLQWINYIRIKKRGVSVVFIVMAFAFSIINAVVTVAAYFEVLAPRIMNLPDHYCVYCMWQYQPLSILGTFLFIIATFSTGWAVLVWFYARKTISRDKVNHYLEKIYLFGFFCIVISLIVQTVLII